MRKKLKLNQMRIAIGFSFFYLAMYVLTLSFSWRLAFLLYACSPLVIVWVVVAVLKDKQEPQRTFDEYFYQDEELRRNTTVRSAPE